MESEACRCADQDSHQKAKALLDALQSLSKKTAPAHELFAKDPWFAIILTRFEYYVELPAGVGKNTSKEVMRGKAALKAKLAWAVENVATITLGHCDEFYMYPWMLGQEESAQAKQLVEKLIGKGAAASSASSSSNKKMVKDAVMPAKASKSGKKAGSSVVKYF